MFTPIRGNDPIWLICFKWVGSTTNYWCLFSHNFNSDRFCTSNLGGTAIGTGIAADPHFSQVAVQERSLVVFLVQGCIWCLCVCVFDVWVKVCFLCCEMWFVVILFMFIKSTYKLIYCVIVIHKLHLQKLYMFRCCYCWWWCCWWWCWSGLLTFGDAWHAP